jgi:hypothetical protein
VHFVNSHCLQVSPSIQTSFKTSPTPCRRRLSSMRDRKLQDLVSLTSCGNFLLILSPFCHFFLHSVPIPGVKRFGPPVNQDGEKRVCRFAGQGRWVVERLFFWPMCLPACVPDLFCCWFIDCRIGFRAMHIWAYTRTSLPQPRPPAPGRRPSDPQLPANVAEEFSKQRQRYFSFGAVSSV